MPTEKSSQETKASYQEGKKAQYERAYLDEEKKWIKLGADGVLYYDLKGLIHMAICPLYALANEDRSFVLHGPGYGFSEGSPQSFSLFYQRPPSEAEQVVWLNTRSLRPFDSDLLAQYVRPSSLVRSLVSSFVSGIMMHGATPKRYRPIIHEFAEAEAAGVKNASPALKRVEATAMSKVIQVCLDGMERRRAAGLEWTLSHVDEPVPFALAFSVTYDSGPGTHLAGVTTLGLSRSQLLSVLDSVRPLSLEDEAVLRRTEEGLNQAERRIYEEVARHFETD